MEFLSETKDQAELLLFFKNLRKSGLRPKFGAINITL